MRTSFVGLVIAVAGLMAAGVIGVSVVRLHDEPARWGWGWSAQPDYFGDEDLSAVAQRPRADRRLDAVGIHTTGGIVLEGRFMSGHAMQALKGSVWFTVLDGRLPTGSDEIALGRQTMRDLGVSIGDTVSATAAGRHATKRLAVVGAVVMPPSEDVTLDAGALLTPAGLASVEQDEPEPTVVLRYPAGADTRRLQAALAAEHDLQFNIFTQPQAPGSIANLSEGAAIARALAAFFIVLGTVGLLHALLVSTRRRRASFAVLRALGFRRRHVRQAIFVEALLICIGAAIVGIPTGSIAGRFIWRAMVQTLGVVDDMKTPWRLMVLIVPATVLLGAILAWTVSRPALARVPGNQLRVE